MWSNTEQAEALKVCLQVRKRIQLLHFITINSHEKNYKIREKGKGGVAK